MKIFLKKDSDPCSNYPCLNGATCNVTNVTNYTCTCPPNYSGNTCQICKYTIIFRLTFSN